MSAAGPARHLTAAPEPMVVPRVHADRATYREWVEQHCTSYAARWDRMKNYDRFVEQWPVLQDWFDAPCGSGCWTGRTACVGNIRTGVRA
jgi:hypothetical protein